MINLKRITMFFLIVLFIIFFLYFAFEKKIINGIIVGYLTGALNFFGISFIVKKIFGVINEVAISKVIKVILIYLIKILLFALVIFLVVTNREIFNIFGFIIGFSLTVIIIFIENLFVKNLN
jgi:hypothetical protein